MAFQIDGMLEQGSTDYQYETRYHVLADGGPGETGSVSSGWFYDIEQARDRAAAMQLEPENKKFTRWVIQRTLVIMRSNIEEILI